MLKHVLKGQTNFYCTGPALQVLDTGHRILQMRASDPWPLPTTKPSSSPSHLFFLRHGLLLAWVSSEARVDSRILTSTYPVLGVLAHSTEFRLLNVVGCGTWIVFKIFPTGPYPSSRCLCCSVENSWITGLSVHLHPWHSLQGAARGCPLKREGAKADTMCLCVCKMHAPEGNPKCVHARLRGLLVSFGTVQVFSE